MLQAKECVLADALLRNEFGFADRAVGGGVF
jgi:hypothetical protein